MSAVRCEGRCQVRIRVRVTGFESTPNPNALKCLMGGDASGRDVGGHTPSIRDGPARSYRSAEEAAGDPLAEALFAVDGVTNVLVMPGWVTVCKRADAAWKPLKPKLKRVIEATAPSPASGMEARRDG